MVLGLGGFLLVFHDFLVSRFFSNLKIIFFKICFSSFLFLFSFEFFSDSEIVQIQYFVPFEIFSISIFI
jgi:hypothetical protein